ncbi:penicillin-binding protein 2 [Brevundimonas terrae]|uniref:Penicillin-binding protein 2 n=1 Tax=Brevundimonas terrae TaxID=363631 RepID=A0ABN0YBL7_9CAUL|nr:penicillin-binding protein 2 [Brevundimonas terrae]NIJ26329.1 cell division protein FtsI (penicillin-binding protein 3) [Brevundimonas terrae]
MSVHDHRDMNWGRPAPGIKAPALDGLMAKIGNRVGALVWDVENAYGRARSHDRAQDDPRFRIFLVMAVFALVFVVLMGGASYAALFADKGRVGYGHSRPMLKRGDLVDRNGLLLATNIAHYGVYIDPREVWDVNVARRQLLAALPRISKTKLDRVLSGDRRLIVATGLTPQEKAAIHDLALGGVTFEPEDRRVYPLGASASHLLGRSDTGGNGVSGVELAFDREIRNAGMGGDDFPISIDMRVQGVVENELAAAIAEADAKAGIAVVADVHTGEILGMASWPTYDPNKPVTEGNNATLNRVISAHYEMGSIFKAYAIAAGVDTGRADRGTLFDASKPFYIGNRRITDFHAKNKVMTLEEVFLHSSNIGTSRLAVEMGDDVMRDYFKRLGLLDAAPIELRESARPTYPQKWGDSTLASLSFGYSIMSTPLQTVAAYGALTNGGRYVAPTLRRGGNPNAETRQVISPETSAVMLELMRGNVARGSGGRANAPGLRVGGKTGSANKLVNGRYNPTVAVGSFAAVFPADGPVNAKRYSVFVLIDEPGHYPRTGGFVAAPAVGRIADRIAEFLGVARKDDRWFTATGERIPQPPVVEEPAR